ncbi:MAG: 5-deoxy-glucuronate isomerase [Acidimicrobiia bacterium]|nr:5-deoxy-glucuronate isomerase [Acidimicrobiia bacterium]MDH4309406.1 5-deoxy-glucuronate isomerase [Acidimicrobiia bacterium]
MKLFHPAGAVGDGTDPVRVSPAMASWHHAGLAIVSLDRGETRSFDFAHEEVAILPLEGSCRVEGGGLDVDLAGRASVFDGVPDLAYLPMGSSVSLSSDTGGRFAMATAVADEERPAFVVRSGDVEIEVRGAGQATRVVNGVLSADVVGPQRLIVVEVLTPAGNWSSYPPHKHDEWSEAEVPIEEIYYFEINGAEGFGFHRTYTLDGEIDETVTVRNGDVFLVPRGYHGPCVAAPGYDMYYLNVMAGPDPERRWLICNDPAHAWVVDGWAGELPDPRAMERKR